MTTETIDHNEAFDPIETRPLYKLLVQGLPDFTKVVENDRKKLKMGEVAAAIGMAKQGVYKRFEPGAENTISIGMARRFVDLSRKQTTGQSGWKPLTLEDFEPFF